jgi:hypothetical protein
MECETANSLLGKIPKQWVVQNSIPIYEEASCLISNGSAIHNVEIAILNFKKKMIWLSVEANMIENGEIKIFCILRDISDRKCHEIEGYIKQQKSKDRLRQNITEIRSHLKKFTKE